VRRSDAVRLVTLSAIWGSSFIFIRVLAPVLGPILTVTTRVLIGGVVLVAYCRIIGLDAQVARHWRQYAVIGIVNSTLPFMLFAFAALYLPASYSVILNSTAPLFTALWAIPLLNESLTRTKLWALSQVLPASCS
jgi:drug/metabolite transporter (DMT)-like permease